jgi:biopolymer transport protein ExbD
MRRGMPESHTVHPNVTPLVDIVMCLIIFYMLVAKIGVDTGADKKIDLPVSLQGNKLEDLGNTVTLNVSAGAEQPFVTTLSTTTGKTEEIKVVEGDKRPLRSLLQVYRRQNERFKVIIRGDQDLDYRFLEPVLVACNEAQVRDVNFATREQTAAR